MLRSTSLILLAVALSSAGCKKKAAVAEPLTAHDLGVQSVDDTLHAVAISPGVVRAQTPTMARVIGAGFAPGATVAVGETALSQVTRSSENTLEVQLPGLAEGVYDVTVTNPNTDSSVLRSGLSVTQVQTEDCKLVLIYFGLNDDGLSDKGKAILDQQLHCYSGSLTPIDIEGHADERGTTDYNLALGQRRARAVVAYLNSHGVTSSRARVVSWGEERPADDTHSELAWSKNRRVEIQMN